MTQRLHPTHTLRSGERPSIFRFGSLLLASLPAGLLALVLIIATVPTSVRAVAPATDAAGQAPAIVLRQTDVVTYYAFLPLISAVNPCAPIPEESYGTLPVIPPPTDRPAEEHPDINLAIRGYESTDAYLGLVDYDGSTDEKAPQLSGLCARGCAPPFTGAYQVHHWDWDNDRRGPPITSPDVTLLGIAVTPGETVHVPDSGYDIGYGYDVLVLYASTERITLKYTREDNVVWGYTIHVEGICVEPTLLALYEEMNSAGREYLPSLRGGQAFGRARSSEVKVAIRDTGAFMDPRARKDWWQGW